MFVNLELLFFSNYSLFLGEKDTYEKCDAIFHTNDTQTAPQVRGSVETIGLDNSSSDGTSYFSIENPSERDDEYNEPFRCDKLKSWLISYVNVEKFYFGLNDCSCDGDMYDYVISRLPTSSDKLVDNNLETNIESIYEPIGNSVIEKEKVRKNASFIMHFKCRIFFCLWMQ